MENFVDMLNAINRAVSPYSYCVGGYDTKNEEDLGFVEIYLLTEMKAKEVSGNDKN